MPKVTYTYGLGWPQEMKGEWQAGVACWTSRFTSKPSLLGLFEMHQKSGFGVPRKSWG